MLEHLNLIEKEILKSIVELPSNEFICVSMLKSVMNNRSIIIYPETKEIQMLTEKEGDSTEMFFNDLLTFISLVEFLKSKNLIFFHENPNIQLNTSLNSAPALLNIENFIERVKKDESQFNITKVNTIYTYIEEYIKNAAFASYNLKEFTNNNFKSAEIIRFEKTLFWTRITALISFIGLIAAIAIPLLLK